MTAWLAVLGAGLGSYALRLTPLLLAGRFTWPDGVDRGLQHAGRAALVYMIITGMAGVVSAGLAPAVGALVGAATALAIGLRGHRLAIVFLAGLAACLLASAATAAVIGLLS
jgi:branched-subunit amino acid transport protein